MTLFEPRCKVCTSNNRRIYEEAFASTPKPSFQELSDKAKVLGEDISYKAFERHLTRHYCTEVATLLEAEGKVGEVVEGAKREVVDTVTEIKNNLNGLKTLLDLTMSAYSNKQMSPTMLRGVTDLYREHRQTIEACERLTSKLMVGTNLSEAEVLKLLYLFSKGLCPECMIKFKETLDEYFKRKGIDKQSE